MEGFRLQATNLQQVLYKINPQKSTNTKVNKCYCIQIIPLNPITLINGSGNQTQNLLMIIGIPASPSKRKRINIQTTIISPLVWDSIHYIKSLDFSISLKMDITFNMKYKNTQLKKGQSLLENICFLEI